MLVCATKIEAADPAPNVLGYTQGRDVLAQKCNVYRSDIGTDWVTERISYQVVGRDALRWSLDID